MHFNADGTFTYTNTGAADDATHNETWKLEGMKITMSFNDGFAIRQGLLDDDTMNGSGSNTKGASWTWTMTKRSRGRYSSSASSFGSSRSLSPSSSTLTSLKVSTRTLFTKRSER